LPLSLLLVGLCLGPALPPIWAQSNPRDEIIVEDEESGETSDRGAEEVATEEGEERIRFESGDEDVTISFKGDADDRVSVGRDVVIEWDEVVEGDLVSVQGDVDVLGTVLGQVVVIAADVYIEGTVEDNVLSILGSVELDPTAVCQGDVLSIGGVVEQNGAQVDGRALAVSIFPGSGHAPGLKNAAIMVIGLSFLTYLLFTVLLGTLFRGNTERMVSQLATRPFHALWVGLAVHVLGQLALFLLLITLIGAPISIIGWFAWWILAQGGLVIAGIRLGQIITARGPEGGIIGPAVLGGLLLHLLVAGGTVAYLSEGVALQTLGITLLTVGVGLQMIMVLLGSGAVVSSRFGASVSGRTERPPDRPVFDPASTSSITGSAGG